MTSTEERRRDVGCEKSCSAGTLSTAQVQELISTEVQSALEQSDKMMKALMERMQEVESEPRYNARLQNLEAHIRKVKRRGDAVFADLRKRRSLDTAQDQNFTPTPEINKQEKNRTSSANGRISGSFRSGDVVSDGGGTTRKPKEGFWQSLRMKNQIVDLTDEEEVCRQNGTKFVDPPQTSSQDNIDIKPSPLEVPEDPGTGLMKKNTPEVQEAEAVLLSRLPPFPDTPFPDQLPVAAASKSMPQKPVVKVAAIKNPQGIALLWNVEEEDPDAAAMDCYYIYVTQQRSDGTFSKWKTMGVIKAMPLPMACRVAAERSRNKTLCFLIIGKDVYGRYGPYSDVHIVWAGEM
ncbi:activating transcription factor 7-interacting protein 2 isoform X3 [Tachysurus fulvidraco]|uniref:activating transcription factor 7-interacting protein 2 isoform X3 n=1 Tax=Tachysurus fulvidraco TaxID=1234273 RepID=UPI000F4E4C51|nr:activating transcription factor 7-interacting protein 2 isoform X3 [Tachysurus fulvidraco]